MKRVTVCGATHALPFAKLLPQLTDARFAELKADIQAIGVLQPIVTATTALWGRIVVDGINRAVIAEELGFDPRVIYLGELTEDEARGRCLALNLKRRHMTIEEQQHARAGRLAKVAALKDEGFSVRQIAAETGVSKSQAQRDLANLAAVSVPGGTPRRKRRPPTERALSNVTSLFGSVRAVMRDKRRRVTLETIAAQHGVPLEGNSWPALDTLRAVLRDVVGGAVTA